ncbi:MAG: CobD/CbiB family cobalamin biosynthesis protein [Solirubrobacteraceae bacterium]
MSAGALIAGYLADLVIGDPRRWHPVAGFGSVARALERAVYQPRRVRGVLAIAALVTGAAATAELLTRACTKLLARAPTKHLHGRDVALATVTWTALGGRSLRREALLQAQMIERGELDQARAALRALCGREATGLQVEDLCRAVIESLAENTSDAVVGALLWGAVGGPAGVAAYRAANTLDAMFGHRSERYEAFGWAAAKLDDALNWPAARLSATITYVTAPLVGGSPALTATVTRRDGGAHPSPNAGRIEAAFAGALGLQLGGPLSYGACTEQRPLLGDGKRPEVADIRRASRLSLIDGTVAALVCASLRYALQHLVSPGPGLR